MSASAMGFGTSPSVTVAVSVGDGAGPVQIGSTTPVTCKVSYANATIDGAATTSVTSTVGTVDSPIAMVCSASSCSQTTSWNVAWDGTGMAPTSANVTCAVKYFYSTGLGTLASGTASATATASLVVPASPPPVISSRTRVDGPVFISSPFPFSVNATDPAGLSLAYAWTASCGAIASSADPASVVWTAPATGGTCTVKVAVSNSVSSSSRVWSVAVSQALFQAEVTAKVRKPRRIAATPDGELFAVSTDGKLHMLTKNGGLRLAVALGSKALAVAASADTVFVGTEDGSIVTIDPVAGRVTGRILPPFYDTVSGLAWDSVHQRLWVSSGDGRVYVMGRDGSILGRLDGPAGRTFHGNVVDVAYDAANDVAWVAEDVFELNADATAGQMVHAFSGSNLAHLRSTATFGSLAGNCQKVNGVAVGAKGKVYVSDSFSGAIQVYGPDGASAGTIGSPGEGPGGLLMPAGLAFMANGDVVVADWGNDRVDRFGDGTPLPTCMVNGQIDTDCDGMPDAWELAHGFNPNDPSDALLDADGDGLTNLEEFKLGTDPRKADTDGDGFSDRVEVLSGFNPLDPNDHKPALTIAGGGQVVPGLVQLNAVVSNGGTCSATWRQLAGAAVTLRNGTTLSPSFVARAAGAYRFEAVATCGAVTTAAATVDVNVTDVAPLADAGRLVVTAPGRVVTLDAGFSSDANGGALSYAWAQLTGPAVATSPRGATLTLRPARPGSYAFEVTATDKGGNATRATVGLVVVSDAVPVAAVASPIVVATVGSPVALDASASLPVGATLGWQQVEIQGTPVALAGAATPSFTPPAPGRYAFEVTACSVARCSPPTKVVVLASAAGVLPVAKAVAPATGAVESSFTLDGTGSVASDASGLKYAWRQVAGPAAGLSGADTATPSVFPFSPGVYVFELSVADGTGAVSAPVTARIDVSAAGKALPVARVSAPPAALPRELVVLDGRASTGGTRFRWTQVAGPWVAIDSTSAAPVFSAVEPATYAFELVVDDGTVRSAPAAVTVNVQ